MNPTQTVSKIKRMMQSSLDGKQMERLSRVLDYCFFEIDTVEIEEYVLTNEEYLERFLATKQLEGCSKRSIKYYRATLQRFLSSTETVICEMTTDDIRSYLAEYQDRGTASQVTLDNVRRIISSLFSWLEDENYILKSPARRIKKVKSAQMVKEVLSDEEIEVLRDGCGSIRDLALIDLLRSTGIRVGELVGLDRSSVDLNSMECRVLGKGNKERTVYFDAKTKVHLRLYLSQRVDDNPALFVSHNSPHPRLQIGGVESLLRNMGRRLGINRVHPHIFRRTLATRAIDKGMPIEQVQVLLGHKKIDTTLRYAMVNQKNVKESHRRYIS